MGCPPCRHGVAIRSERCFWGPRSPGLPRLRYISRRILAAGLLAVASAACPNWLWGQDAISFGFVCAATGRGPDETRCARYAVEDQVAEINAQGGICGRKINLAVYDPEDDAEGVIPGAARLIDEDHVVGIITPEGSGSGLRVEPIADLHAVPVVATAPTYFQFARDEEGRVVDGQVNPYLFRVGVAGPYQPRVAADYAVQDLGKCRAAFIYDQSDHACTGYVAACWNEFIELGGVVAAREYYTYGEREFRYKLRRIAKSSPDCLFIAAASGLDAARIAKQASQLGLKIQFLGNETWAVDDVLALAGQELEGSCLTTGVFSGDLEVADFNANFILSHGMTCQPAAYYALDAIMALEYAAQASLERTGRVDGTTMKNALERMQEVPVFTGTLTMDPETHVPIARPVVVQAIWDGGWQEAKTFHPE